MSKKKRVPRPKRPRLFPGMLFAELKNYIKPYSIAFIFYAFSLTLTVCSILYIKAIKNFAYALLYISIIALFCVTAIVPIRRTLISVKTCEKFDASPSPGELSAAKIVATLILSVISATLHASADATVTHLGQLTYDGYTKTLLSVSAVLMSFVFYMTCVAVTAVSDYKFDPKKSKRSRRRRITMDGILLYALGLTVLMLAFLCLSTIPFGSDALEDLSSTGMNPNSSLAIAIIYLSVSLLRSVYLFFVLKRRLRRALKLYS